MSDKTETRSHHLFSPSQLDSLQACPCYTSAHSESEAAFAGTIQHDAVESAADDARLSDRQASAVAQCIQFSEERAAQYPGGLIVREEYLPIDDRLYVVEVNGKKQVVESTTAGYLDFAVISADFKTAEITDWKFGKNVVTAAQFNLQGIAYMLGLKRKFPTLETCTVRFLQPHIDDSSEHTFDLGETEAALRLQILTVVSRAVEARREAMDFSQARPNQSACLWCANAGRCPALATVALNVGKKFAPLDIPASISTVVFEDPAQVATGLRLASVIKTWAEAYRTQVTAKSIESDFIPVGYKLVSTAKRSVVNAKLFGDLAKTYLPPEDFEKVEALYEIAIGKVEKLISTAAPRGTKEAKVDEFGAAALAAGAVLTGAPFAFLRQDSKTA